MKSIHCIFTEKMRFMSFIYSIFVFDATRNREISALQKVGKFLNAKRCMIITYDQDETTPSTELGMDIEVVPVYKFLLAE